MVGVVSVSRLRFVVVRWCPVSLCQRRLLLLVFQQRVVVCWCSRPVVQSVGCAVDVESRSRATDVVVDDYCVTGDFLLLIMFFQFICCL